MTNLEALRLEVAVAVKDEALLKALTDHAVDADQEYQPSQRRQLIPPAIDLLLSQSVSSQSEGGYSISYKDNIDKRINYLRALYKGGSSVDSAGLAEAKPTVRSNPRW